MVLFKQIVTLICTPCIEEKKKKLLSPQETTGEKEFLTFQKPKNHGSCNPAKRVDKIRMTAGRKETAKNGKPILLADWIKSVSTRPKEKKRKERKKKQKKIVRMRSKEEHVA
jgi:hypothetical protein